MTEKADQQSTSPQPQRPQYGEQRPRPQYGEYATPEVQAKAMGASSPPVGKPVTVNAPPPPVPVSTVSPPPAPSTVNRGLENPKRGSAASGTRPARRWDLFLSILLIAYGATIVFSGFGNGPTLAPQMSEVYSRMGLGTYTATALAGSLGRIVNFVNAILFVITLIVTGTLLRRGHIAFYVPLIAGIITTIFSAICLVALLAQDPGALSHFGG